MSFSGGALKTATLVAKILNATAFFSPTHAPRDQELTLFLDLIKTQSAQMIDYLSCVSSGLSYNPKPEPSSAAGWVEERSRELPSDLADTIPISTAMGPIDLQAELAILGATIHQRRSTDLALQSKTSGASASDETLDFITRLDRQLSDLHGAYPDLPITPEKSPRCLKHYPIVASEIEDLIPYVRPSDRQPSDESVVTLSRPVTRLPGSYGTTPVSRPRRQGLTRENAIKRSFSGQEIGHNGQT